MSEREREREREREKERCEWGGGVKAVMQERLKVEKEPVERRLDRKKL